MTDWSVIFIKAWRIIVIVTTTNDNKNDNMTITTDERIKINIEYLTWLYAKSKEEKNKKQHKGLLNTRQAIELIIRDAGGEKVLKELFLNEEDEKIMYELTKLNPMKAETFKQDREGGFQAFNRIIADLQK
jgi:nitrate reductase beta subunit